MKKGSAHIPSALSTMVDLLGWRAQWQPQRLAYRFLVDGETEVQSVTYEVLDRRARAIAHRLQALNCTGQRALLLYPAGLDYIAAFFGCLYAGTIAVPAYPPRPNRSLERIQAIIHDAEATIALTDGAILPTLEKRFGDCADLKGLHWLNTDAVDDALADDWSGVEIGSDNLALLQYTSGSTAAPKGVMISHDNLLHNSSLIHQSFQDTPDSAGVSWLPPYHDMGLVGGILQPLYVGAPMTLMSPVAFLQKPLRWLQAISRYQATTSGGPNFAYDLCVRKTTPQQRAELDLSTWRLAFSGAEPIHHETLAHFAAAFAPAGFDRRAFYPCYGMAEATLLVSGNRPGQPPQHCTVDSKALRHHRVLTAAASSTDGSTEAQVFVGCGQAVRDQSIVIVDPDTGRACPADRVGEIWLGSSRSIAQGYWQQPQATAHAFRAYRRDTGEGPCLRTGDLGFLRDGQLYITGRLKDLIIIRGRNHYPQDIEATVEKAHEALRPGAGTAFSVNIAGAERLVVVQEVERRHLRHLEPEAIVAAVRRRVAEGHDLQLYALVLLKTGSLPKTSSGKVQRYLCRIGFLDQHLQSVYTWEDETLAGSLLQQGAAGMRPDDGVATVALPPPTERTAMAMQDWMVAWLAQALRLPVTAIDATQPFAEFGLDSMTAIELVEALETALGRPLSPTLVYEYPTIAALAGYLAAPADSPAHASHATTLTPDDPEVDQLVRELEMLSDSEIQELLGKQGR
ncbi:peptide synthetase [Halomicronema hongdechloris C2206]|uniref:Peptide synthetase n=1 Tax=Halomicronema hongdechloris C2206 TaxID=1641165 RepID=A0A1Z3HUR4_9CYAN|nr:AMP-binding protein [Halomicronema hongdechloris]ASC74061.1 peptide synthetase [Halomicronema hongdechloris C2206]